MRKSLRILRSLSPWEKRTIIPRPKSKLLLICLLIPTLPTKVYQSLFKASTIMLSKLNRKKIKRKRKPKSPNKAKNPKRKNSSLTKINSTSILLMVTVLKKNPPNPNNQSKKLKHKSPNKKTSPTKNKKLIRNQ